MNIKTCPRCSIFKLQHFLLLFFLFQTTLALAQTYHGKVGVGLGFNGWQLPFVDVAKTARSYTKPDGTTVPKDALGWPMADAQTVLMDMRPAPEWAGSIDDPDQFRLDVSGTYQCSFTGQATVVAVEGSITIGTQSYDAATNTTTFDLTLAPPGPHHGVVIINFLNTKRTPESATNTGFTNFKAIRPGYDANTTQVYTSYFLDAIKSAEFAVLRMLGPLRSNDNNYVFYPSRVEWSQRRTMDAATWEGDDNGQENAIPWEIVVDVANISNMDLWINVPHAASDDYVQQLAAFIKNRLNPELTLYVEYSNEVWNWGFPQSWWNNEKSKAEGLNHIKGYSKRTVELAKIFQSVYGPTSLNNKVRVINSWQIGWNPPDAMYEEQMQYINATFGPPKDFIYGLGVAPYFNCGDVCETGSVQQIIDEMRRSSDASKLDRQKIVAVAAKWQIPGGMVAYEGGSDTGGGSATNIANKIRAERSPEIREIFLRDLKENWFDIGGGLFVYLELASPYSRYGSWGLTDDIRNVNRNSKFGAVRDLIGTAPTTAPPVPTGLTATAVDGSVNLSWSASSTAIEYKVKRSTESGGPYTVVGVPATSSFSDGNVTNGTTYYYVVSAVNAVGESANSTEVSSIPSSLLTIKREYWLNVPGASVAEIPVNTSPTGTENLTALEAPQDLGDNYGARIRAYLKPAVSGDYIFYVASDDRSQVLLSTNNDPANKVVVAEVTDWTSFRQWDKLPGQQSAAISLVAGQEYYIEVLHKEATGGDHVSVGWTGPGISEITVIGSPYLAPYGSQEPTVPPAPTGLTATKGDSTVSLSWNAVAEATSYNIKRHTGGNFNTVASGITTNSYQDLNLVNGTTYFYVVTAVNAQGESNISNTVQATPGATEPSAGAKSLDLSFTDAADADRFSFVFDTGGESVKTVENGVMKLVLNKASWHFYQLMIDPFDFVNNPYVSFRIKVDQATPIRMWIKKGVDTGIEKELYNQTLQASADYQTIQLHFTDLAPLVGDMTELGIDFGGYQGEEGNRFAGTVYLDHFRLGQAAMPDASAGAKSLDLSFTDAADADRFNFVFDTGGESVKTVENGVMKLVLNKASWHFYQLMIDPFDFVNNPYVSFRVKVDQATPMRMWIKKGVDTGIEKELYNQTLQASADYQTVQLHFTDLAPLVGDMTELGIDFGGYQGEEGNRFAGTVYLDYFRLGQAAMPGGDTLDTEAPTAPTALQASAITSNSFTLNWTAASDNVAVTAYKVYRDDVLVATTTTTTAQLSGLSAQTAYSIKVSAQDAAGNSSTSQPLTVTTSAPAPLPIAREVWSNLSGEGIASIPLDTPPDSVTQLTSLQTPVNVGDNYGTRIRAYITPAVTGYYTFYITADDVAQLWLSHNEDPEAITQIAKVKKAVKPGKWKKRKSQRSVERLLTAGVKYYVEVLHRETVGKDHVAVGWTGPGIRKVTVVGGSVLSPYVVENPEPTYALTVGSGTGSGSYAEGAVVNIIANAAPEGKVFDAWTGNIETVANVQAASTTLTMPAAAISIMATYKDQPSEVALSINKNTKHQTIDGFGFFGARDVWWGSSDTAHFYSEAWLDKIVSDLGVSMWRNELYPHNPPTGNTTPNQDASWNKQRPMVQALKAKADQYGVDMRMILTVWSPPGEFKWKSTMTWAGDESATRGPGPNGDYWSERAGGTLNPNKYNAFAGWLSQGLQMYKNIGINVYAISPQNEPMFAQTFNSNTYTSQWYADMINAVIPQVKAQHPDVKVYGSENMLDMEGADNNFPYFYHSKLKSDPTAMSHIDALAVHGYLDGVAASSGSKLASYWTNHKREFTDPANKKAWMTETSGYVDAWEGANGQPGAFGLANDIHTALYYGDLSAWLYWQGSGLGGINEFNLMSDLEVNKKYYASKNFYRFIRPGAVRLATNSPDTAVALTAYEHAANGTHTIVLINNAATSKSINLAMTGSGLPDTFEMFVTSASKNCESEGNVSGTGTITLPARSVVTLQAGGMPLSGNGSPEQAKIASEGANKGAKLEGVKIFPNPTSGIVSVSTGAAKEVKATLYTIQGAPLNVKVNHHAGNLSFDITGQPAGIYILRLEADGQSKTFKIVKE